MYLNKVHNSKILIKKLKKTGAILVICLFTGLLFSSFNKDEPKGIKIVVIDAGHGGKDPGCNGVTFKEKDVSLAVALRLGKYIEDNYKDVKVIYTRKTDVFVELEDRAQIANKNKADLFISIHCNAAGKPVMIRDKKTGKLRAKTYTNKKGKKVIVETTNPIPFGSETYVMGLKNEEGKMKVAQRENSVILLEDNYEQKYAGFDPESEESYIIMSNYTSAYVIQSAQLAIKIQSEYASKAGRVDKGVHRQSIWVLWRTAMPSILTEIGFLTNPLEEQFLGSENGQKYVATSLFNGFRKFKDELEGTKKEYDDEFTKLEPLENENLKAGNTGKPVKEDDFSVEEENGNGKTTTAKADSTKTETPHIKEIDPANQLKNESEVIKYDKPIEIENKGDIIAMEPMKQPVIANNSSVNEDKPESVPAKIDTEKIEFKVQFASSDVELDLKDTKFSAIENGSFYKVGSFLKYTSGNFSNAETAFKHQAKLRDAGFKDCFTVAFKNGQRIDLKEAKALSEKK